MRSRAHSSAGERSLHTREDGGSIPPAPTTFPCIHAGLRTSGAQTFLAFDRPVSWGLNARMMLETPPAGLSGGRVVGLYAPSKRNEQGARRSVPWGPLFVAPECQGVARNSMDGMNDRLKELGERTDDQELRAGSQERRADSQQERTDVRQERIDLAARELADISDRLQAAAQALRDAI